MHHENIVEAEDIKSNGNKVKENEDKTNTKKLAQSKDKLAKSNEEMKKKSKSFSHLAFKFLSLCSLDVFGFGIDNQDDNKTQQH